MDLFEAASYENAPIAQPLAEKLRPKSLEFFFGHENSVGENSSLVKNIKRAGHVPNLILWGPPGTGKTTFALLLSSLVEAEFVVVNAIDTGAKKLKEIGQQARERKLHFGKPTLLFVDEIHRFNKAQQDVLLPFSEKGDFSLIGATTENPSYELNSALLSRCRVVVFDKHKESDLEKMLQRACEAEEWSMEDVLTEESKKHLLHISDGDARRLLNVLEIIFQCKKTEQYDWPLSQENLEEVCQGSPIYYDKTGDEHYNCISAFIKSIRGSDPDAAIYYLARMLKGGEDPVFIARRLVVLASEDIGNADPRALTLATSGLQAVELVGMPEARVNLAQVTTYLASSPKSNSSYMAINKAMEFVDKTGQLAVPKSLRSAKTKLAKSLGFGKGYRYSHNGEKGFVAQEFLPEKAQGEVFYEPVERGFEKNIRAYLQWMKE